MLLPAFLFVCVCVRLFLDEVAPPGLFRLFTFACCVVRLACVRLVGVILCMFAWRLRSHVRLFRMGLLRLVCSAWCVCVCVFAGVCCTPGLFPHGMRSPGTFRMVFLFAGLLLLPSPS